MDRTKTEKWTDYLRIRPLKVISTNIGEKRSIDWKGKIVETGIFKKPTHEAIYLGQTDVEKDKVVDRKHHGGIDKACYAYSSDHYPFWQEQFPDVDFTFGAFGENLTIEGLDESKINIGDQFKIGEEVIVEVAQPRQPCMKLGIRFNDQKVVKRFINENFPGVYFRVLNEGWVVSGDTIIPHKESKSNLSLVEVHSLLSKNKNEDLAKKAILMDELAFSYKEDIKRVYKL